LLAELRSTHTSAEWFVPADTAVKGLTAEQANWTDGKGNHSVGQLAYHLVFWNRRNLARLKGENLEKFSGNNDETFDKFDSKTWNETVKQLDEVMNELEKCFNSSLLAPAACFACSKGRVSLSNSSRALPARSRPRSTAVRANDMIAFCCSSGGKLKILCDRLIAHRLC
jgi:hypothetical protein